jgi:hypothetical protein
MRFSKSSFTRAATVAVSTALAMGGAVALAPSANAAYTETNYGFQSTAYGTRLQAPVAQIGVPRTAFSFVSCTRLAGVNKPNSLEEELLGSDVTNAIPVKVNTIKTSSRSFRDLKNNIAAASQGSTTIGAVRLGGDQGLPEVTLDGLRTVSTAWADKAGKLHAKNDVSALDIGIDLGGYVPETGTPLDQLLDIVTGTVDDVLDQVVALLQQTGRITIPGLGELSLTGFDRHGVNKAKTTAYASSFILRFDLFGLDGDKNTLEDNTTVSLGRSWARLTKGVKSGVMSGDGVGSRISASNPLGIGNIGDIGWKQLPCEGTAGKVLTRTAKALQVGQQNKATLSGIGGSSYGEQLRRGKAVTWTRGTVGKLQVGALTVEGLVGRTNVRQGSNGAVSTNFAGSRIGRIKLGDKVLAQGITPRTAKSVKLPQIDGILEIKLFARDKWRRGGNISALKIVLADAVSPITINLGFSRAAIKRF